MTTTFKTTPANFTRHSTSFVRKFAQEGRWHFIPLYWLLKLSDFAREGMEHSGSYQFADHMYRNVPSGRGIIGRWLDALLLKLPATRSMRSRCAESQAAMQRALSKHLQEHDRAPFRVLSVPCGLPRDVRDLVSAVALQDPRAARLVEYTGMDVDPEVVEKARGFLANTLLASAPITVGDALKLAEYPETVPHFIASTGLGEFLDDGDLALFYQNVHATLAPGGTFFTSAAARGHGSATLLSAFEFEVHYRTSAELSRILQEQPWKSVELWHDQVGLQTFVRAVKA